MPEALATTFRVAARALRQLGAELITSDDVALNELIKNAFDARSPRVAVEIFAPADAAIWSLAAEDLRRGKTSVAVTLVRAERALSDGLRAEERATVLAGLRAHAESSSGLESFLTRSLKELFYIRVKDTGCGMTPEELSNKFLVIGTPNKFMTKRGRSSQDGPILGDKGIGRLSMMRLGNKAVVRSRADDSKPWQRISFDWNVFNDPSLFLDKIQLETGVDNSDMGGVGTEIVIRELSAHWSEEKVKGFINKYLRRLQNPFEDEIGPYPIDILLNGVRPPIASIPLWLTKCAQFSAKVTFSPGGEDGDPILRRVLRWRGTESDEIRSWTTKELIQQLGIPAEICNRLGPFVAQCLWFNRQGLVSPDINKTRKDITDELNLWCGGFSVYRDGFRVGKTGGMEDDWLEWDSGALKSKGFTLNRYQTVGSVSISSNLNPWLIDSANREGLVACPEQLLLKRLLGEIIVMDLRGHIDATKQAEAKIVIAEESTEDSLSRSEDSLRKVLRNVDDIGRILPASEKAKVKEIHEAVQEQIEYVNTIKAALQLSRETRVELLELANIGLVVEIVIHELSRLTETTGELLADLEKNAARGDGSFEAVVDNLRAQIKATNKRIRSVDVMSPSGRHRKERYDAVKQTRAIVDGFKARLKRHDIDCVLTLDGASNDGSLEVHMVRGLIAQSLENLLTNSIYWVQQGLRSGDSRRCIAINIESRSKVISVTDNGPGVDPRYAKEIFKPYFTTRRKGKGLGLYIASELVEYHGGKIYLDAVPDEDGRLRTFNVELPRE